MLSCIPIKKSDESRQDEIKEELLKQGDIVKALKKGCVIQSKSELIIKHTDIKHFKGSIKKAIAVVTVKGDKHNEYILFELRNKEAQKRSFNIFTTDEPALTEIHKCKFIQGRTSCKIRRKIVVCFRYLSKGRK